MVDFNNEATVGTPATEVVKILLLQRRYDLMEALEKYYKDKFQQTETDLTIVKARLLTLFLEMQAGLKRRLKKTEYDLLIQKINADTESELNEAILTLNEELDKINLTKIDTRKVFDTSRALLENKVKGL